MLKISREDIEAAKKSDNRIASYIQKSVGVSFAILLAISTASFSLSGNRLIISVLIVAFNCVILFYTQYIACYFIYKKRYGKKTKSIIKYVKKYKKLNDLQSVEICSDRFLAHLNTYINEETDAFNLFSLKVTRFYTYLNRWENEAAYKELQDIEKNFDEKFHCNSDIVFVKLNYAMQTDDDLFRRLVNENLELLEKEKDGYHSALAYSLLSVHEKRIGGNFTEAVEQLNLNEEYLFKQVEAPIYKCDIQKKNRTFFRYAATLLDKAELLLNMGEKEESTETLKKSYEYIQKLSCDIPEIYTQNRLKLMSKIGSENEYVLRQTLD